MAKDDFYIINSWMIDELNLSGIELQVFAIIWSLSRGEKQMYIAGNAHLIKMTKKTENTIISALKKLLDKGYIQRLPVVVNNVKRNYYKAITQGTAKIEVGYLKNLSSGTAKIEVPYIESNIESNIKDNKSVSNDTPKVTEFEDFYKLYPLKKSKAPAEKSWNKLSEKDRQAAIQSLPAYIADCALNKRSFKHPSTFLNQRTWEDEFGVKPSIAFYDPIDGEDEQKTRFKRWMRANFPEIENTALPLSYEDYMKLVQGDNVENVTNALMEINSEIYKYRKSDIAQVVRAMLPNEEEEDYD